jgi:hypothetical protein
MNSVVHIRGAQFEMSQLRLYRVDKLTVESPSYLYAQGRNSISECWSCSIRPPSEITWELSAEARRIIMRRGVILSEGRKIGSADVQSTRPRVHTGRLRAVPLSYNLHKTQASTRFRDFRKKTRSYTSTEFKKNVSRSTSWQTSNEQ